jgi:cytochrome o ubiquinol oxidase subunit 2
MRYSLLAVVLTGAATLGGCTEGVLDPKGPIASAERLILFNALGIMLAIVIPVILATLAVAQVVSLDWKWVFIYPEQGIASVNKLVVPVGTPISFELTSSSVMNSFFVPQLGGQIYTMSGMVTRLHLQADHPGTYPGLSAMFSGDGFADMRFAVDAVPNDQFAQWVGQAREAGPVLDTRSYKELAKPSQAIAPFTYRAIAADFFSGVVNTASIAGDSSQFICSTSERVE